MGQTPRKLCPGSVRTAKRWKTTAKSISDGSAQSAGRERASMNPKQKKLLIRILAAAVLYVPLLLIAEGMVKVDIPPVLLFLLFLVPYLMTGYDVLWKAVRGIIKRKPFDEHFLMAIATVGAIVLGQYPESVAVMLLYQVGELFQSYAVGKSRRSISELMDIRPDYANIEGDSGQLEKVDPDEVETGSIIVVQPGEKVPIDGIVVEGSSSLDTAALTGESMPREVGPDSAVLSGMINMSGVLKIRTTAEFEESTASKILDLVENAASRKANAENFISKFARVYTPIVVYAALVLGIAVPVICMITGLGHDATVAEIWKDWLLRACTFLVISCPCAFVISVPLSFFAGLGGAGSQGILIKGSNYLEVLAKVKTIAFDKTGTITKGNFAVAGVHHSPVEADRILEYAALAECHSSHPISASLQKAYGKTVDQTRVTEVQEISGHGVEAVIDGRVHVAVGNDRLMREIGVEPIDCHHIGTVIHVAADGRYAGHILITDELKEHAREAMSELKKAGVEKEVMLTGDIEKVAASVAKEVGLNDYRAGLLPADKVTVVEELLKEREGTGKKVAFVGDGINDAPVLARADIGIAMGALGSDAAIEAADVVLMNDDPLKISKAIRISRKCLRIVHQNIFFTLTVKIVCLVLGALGIANMWAAIPTSCWAP